MGGMNAMDPSSSGVDDTSYPPYDQPHPPGNAPSAPPLFAQPHFPASPAAEQSAPLYSPYGPPQAYPYPYAHSAVALPPPAPHETSTSFSLAGRQHQRDSGQAATNQPYSFPAPHAPIPSTSYVPPDEPYSPFPLAAIPSRGDEHYAPSPPLATRPPQPYPFASPPFEALEPFDLVAAQSFASTKVSPAPPRAALPSSAPASLQPSRFDAGPSGRRTSQETISGSRSWSGPAQVGQAGSRGAGSPAVTASGVTGPAAIAALAAGLGARTTEKSCKNCRVRKVKCDRQWPRCQRCKDRNEQCDFGTFVPVDAIPVSALQVASSSPGETGRVAELEARIESLQAQIAAMQPSSAHSSPFAVLTGSPPTTVPPALSPTGTFRPALISHSDLTAFARPPGLLLHDPNLTPLSEGIRLAFVAGAAGGTGQHIQTYLQDVALSDPTTLGTGVATLTGQFGAGGRDVGAGLEAIGVFEVGESAPDWRLARSAMARMLVIQLVQSFFNCCCAYLPSFHAWHTRRPSLLRNVDNLDPASRVAVAAFCAMGARASPHSALLGIPVPSPHIGDEFSHASTAGIRREQACRALHTQALDLAHLLGIVHDSTRDNLEVLMVMVQLLIFNELIPRRSRSFVHSAMLQFKELQERAQSPAVKEELVQSIGVPLFTCDAITSAYARKTPLISSSDLMTYFPSFSVPDLRTERIKTILQDCLSRNVGPDALLTHEGIGRAVVVVHCWVATCQREFAEVAAASLGRAPTSEVLHHLWEAFDQIHEGVRRLQELLVHLAYVPSGCAADGCTDQHLRFITRLDKDLIDLIFLIHSLLAETYTPSAAVDLQETYRESCCRVRKALKLVAFYSELYITSRDPHMTYHVFWQLELLPNWTDLVCQRHGEAEGPESPDLEVSETELDWFEKGLMCASYYHPLAISRLAQLRQHRRPSFAPRPPATGFHAPPHPVVPPSSLGPGPGPAPAPPYLLPELRYSPFQGGVTDPNAGKSWGDWRGSEPDG
ncbi:hypothetical protein JCM1840_005505 [Sporobolomyces johnsonii]